MEVNKNAVGTEALGIIISRGSRAEPEPRFSRYEWGPAPEPDPDASTKAA
jgi:hypothetical protein